MLMALFPRSVIRLVLVVVLSVASPSKAAVTVPKWQSVVPDTNHVIPLFGNLSQHSYPHAHAHAHAHTVWTLESLDRVYTNLTAHVPGDLISDLMNNGLVDDPYFNRNFLIQRDVWMGPYPSNSKYNSNCNSTNYEHDEHSKRQRTRTWKYTTHFSLPTTHSTTNLSWKLVLESVKMGAVVAVNGVTIGTVQDQFLRYILTIDDSVLQLSSSPSSSSSSSWKNGLRQHELTMTFDPGTSIHLHGRFMACSGGWDWAPYAQQVDGDGISMFTFGIIQPVYLVGVRHQYITDVVPKIYYQATTTVTYPNKPLRNGPQADFLLQVFVHMEHVQGTNTVGGGPLTNRSLVLRTDFGDQVQVVVPSQPPSSDYSTVQILNVTVPKHLVNLWWPNGMGDQPLYPIVLGFEQQQQQQHDNNSIPSTGSNSFSWEIQKRVGFRTAALVTINETDESTMGRVLQNDSAEGSGNHGMYFRINGAVVMARGANFIPMDQLEGRLTDDAHRLAVHSAVAANMNMLRIWGGGMVLPSAFYEACDEGGILLYHDMMFVEEEGHGPTRTETIEHEIRHLVRSLAPHPSIVLWNGCNECSVVMGTPTEIYATFVMQTVAEEDDTRSIWPSSPSKVGWATGVHTIDSRPNGNPLSTKERTLSFDEGRQDDAHVAESHGPYQRAFSMTHPAVNGQDFHSKYENTPPKLDRDNIGVEFKNTFASEFGASVMSSFESMSGTMSSGSWGLHGGSSPDTCENVIGNKNKCEGNNNMAERNYPCDTHIVAYFGNHTSLDGIGESAFQMQLYQCMVAQSLWMKGEIEKRRSKNSFGLLIWQLNENWPTGGWGAIEYGTEAQGQVTGGRWKPLMYMMESFLFRDVIAACGQEDQCYVRNDGMQAVNVTVALEAWSLHAPRENDAVNYTFFLEGGSIARFASPNSYQSARDDVLLVGVSSDTGAKLVGESIFLWNLPKAIPGLWDYPASITVQSIRADTNGTAVVTLLSDRLALYVILSTRAQGRFTENAFALRPTQPKYVTFQSLLPGGAIDVSLLQQSLRVEHLGSGISPEPRFAADLSSR